MRAWAVPISVLLAACGARTGLYADVAPVDARADASDATDATDAADVADARDAPPDAPVDVRPPRCTADAQCDGAVACARGLCDVTTGQCSQRPDDRLCPISHRCDVARGCVARALAVTDSQLFEVELPSATLRAIGPVRPFTDVALHPDRTLYAVTGAGQLWLINPDDGTAVYDASLNRGLTALDAAPDGTLFAAGGDAIYRVNRGAATLERVATFPVTMIASGDIAFLQGRLLATATPGSTMDDTLVEFDPGAGTSRVVGSTGYRCVWALAAFGPALYGMTCEGYVVSLDAATGAGREIARRPVRFYGATAR